MKSTRGPTKTAGLARRALGWEPFGFLAMLLELLGWRFAAVVLVTLAIGLVSGVALVMLMPMLQVIGLEVSGGAGQQLVEVIFDVLARIGLEANLPTVLALNAAVVVAVALLTRWQSTFSARLNQRVVRELRERLYSSICRADWLYLARERSARFSHVLLGEVERVGGAMSALVSLLVAAARALVYTVIAVALSPAVTAMTLAFGLLLALLLMRSTRLGRTTGEAVSDAYQNLYSATAEHLAGLKLTKSHGLEENQARSFRLINDRVALSHVAVVSNQADVAFWLQSGTVLGLGLIIYGALAVLELPLATTLLLLYLFSRLLPMLAGVQRNYQSLLTMLPAYTRFDSTLRQSDAFRESSRDKPFSFSLAGGIEMREVTFSYPGGDCAGLDAVDLSIGEGETVAVVGPSGAGKSTLADVLIGLIEPDSGRVVIGGEELTRERRQAWRRQVAYVSQDVFLFHDTIRANLQLVDPRAGDEEMWQALDSAAAEFVRQLPDGLETVVGDRGVRLSGGERQRLVLARALLRHPSLLVLDEATSALDAHNEERIREAIERLEGKMTIVVIAHRLATVRSAHTVHVLQAGRLVESGGWEELLGKEAGSFKALAEAQGLVQPALSG